MQHDFILLDRSGSMGEGARWRETLSAINGYVGQLATDKVDTGVTLIAFDRNDRQMSFETLRDRIIPHTWKPVSEMDATPRGTTPLNDAVARLAQQVLNSAYDRVIVVILTDGYENSSLEFSQEQAKKLLDDVRARGFAVIFIGADMDKHGHYRQSAAYGGAAGQTVSASSATIGGTMKFSASNRAAYGVTGATADMDFSDDQKRAAEQSAAKK